jgi:hypothetical protein
MDRDGSRIKVLGGESLLFEFWEAGVSLVEVAQDSVMS